MVFKEEKTAHVRLPEDQLEDLINKLGMTRDLTGSGSVGGVRDYGSKPRKKLNVIEEKEVDVKTDIIDTLSRGIDIARNLEALSLFKLYKLEKKDIPSQIQAMSGDRGYKFYVITPTINIRVPHDEKLTLKTVEFSFSLTDDVRKENRHAVAYDIFPANQDKVVVEVSGNAKIAVNTSGKIALNNVDIKTPFGGINFGAEVITEAEAEVVLNVGQIQITKSIIATSGRNSDTPYWRFNGKFRTQDHQVLAILQVPEEAKKLKIQAEVRAYPHKNRWEQIWGLSVPPWVDTHTTTLDLKEVEDETTKTKRVKT